MLQEKWSFKEIYIMQQFPDNMVNSNAQLEEYWTAQIMACNF